MPVVETMERVVRPSEMEPISPELCAALLQHEVWHAALENFAQATNLAVALVDSTGGILRRCYNPRPTWSVFRRAKPAGAGECQFALSLRGCRCIIDAAASSGPILVSDRLGLFHFAVPLGLGDKLIGALIAGQVFTQFPGQLEVTFEAKRFGLSPGLAWQQARRETPLKRATLQVYASLLTTLGRTILSARYSLLMEAQRLAEMTLLRSEADRAREDMRMRTEELQEAFKQLRASNVDRRAAERALDESERRQK